MIDKLRWRPNAANTMAAAWLLLGAALTAGFLTDIADAKQPKLRSAFVKHDALNTIETYKARWEPNWLTIDDSQTRLTRRSRTDINVRFKVTFSDDWNGCMDKPDHPDTYWAPGGTNPAGQECPAGSIWSEEWDGEVHSWTIRYQAWGGHRISKWFKGDRRAELNPESRRFGGSALSKRSISGVYDQSQWEYPLSEWAAYPLDPYEEDPYEDE